MVLFSDPDSVGLLPLPLARPIQIMLSEITLSGEETTADETTACIEAFAAWMGRLWSAEYLRAITLDADRSHPTLNSLMFARLASGKPTLTGQWIGLARGASQALRGWPTVVHGLSAIDFGQPGDGSPVDRLLHFRNHFSHGSFTSTIAEIRRHRQLLHDLLVQLPALHEQPVRYRAAADREALMLRGAVERDPDPPAGLEPAHPSIAGADGALLDLYPLLVAHHDSGAWHLHAGDAAAAGPILRQHPGLRVWLERYDRQRGGHLPYSGTAAPAHLPEETITALRGVLATPAPGLILLEGHPGCHGASAVAALQSSDPLELGLERFADLRRVVIRAGEVSQSGPAMAAMVLRMTERALGEPEGHRKPDRATLLHADGPLMKAAEDLRSAGESILLGLEDLPQGQHPYRGESVTVLDVIERLVGSPITLLATLAPGSIQRPLHDHKLTLPIAEDIAPQALSPWLPLLLRTPLHRQVLEVLCAAPAPMHLFAVCDALEVAGASVFEPAVERALWDLRPLLVWTRAMTEVTAGTRATLRVWSAYHPALADALRSL